MTKQYQGLRHFSGFLGSLQPLPSPSPKFNRRHPTQSSKMNTFEKYYSFSEIDDINSYFAGHANVLIDSPKENAKEGKPRPHARPSRNRIIFRFLKHLSLIPLNLDVLDVETGSSSISSTSYFHRHGMLLR